jgi:hypothetical protein
VSALKSQFGLIACAVYVVIAALAFIHDLTRKPSTLILFDELLPVIVLPGMLILATPLELMGLNVNEEPYRTPLLIASAVLTVVIVYLLGSGVEALYRSASR